MNNPDSPPPTSPRRTLKLKVPARKPPEASKAPPGANANANTNANASASASANKKVDSKPGAHWSDEYKRRMQADMDELNSGRD
jgi:hypothetical protein